MSETELVYDLIIWILKKGNQELSEKAALKNIFLRKLH